LIALPDVNVLLALAWEQHVHHDAAHAWFGISAADGWATCLFTQTGFLRLSLNPQVVHVAVDCGTAQSLLAGLVGHPSHRFLSDAPALTSNEFDPIAHRISGYRQMSDATLLFLARASGMKFVTFDQSVVTICPWPENIEILAR
jgi:toxin-antitoxin system PIN domain toxin